MELYGNLDAEKAMAGMLYGVNPNTIVSILGKETINFGKGVFLNGARTAVLNGKHNNKATVDLSAYTTASKVIKLTINGVDTTVTTTSVIATDTLDVLQPNVSATTSAILSAHCFFCSSVLPGKHCISICGIIIPLQSQFVLVFVFHTINHNSFAKQIAPSSLS